MASTVDINIALVKGMLYALDLGGDLLANQKSGCTDDHLSDKIDRIIQLVDTLQYYIDNNLSDKTGRIYEILLDIIKDYDGNILPLDPNVYIPNTTIATGGGQGIWGSITGDIENQLDLIAKIFAPSWTVYGTQPFGKYGNAQVVPEAPTAYLQYKEAWTNIAPPVYLTPLDTNFNTSNNRTRSRTKYSS